MAFQATPGTDPAIVPRPTSCGGTRGLGESFQPDLNTGTGNYQIPLWFPRGPNQFAPKIALTYSTGFGNGEFGLGWSLQLMNVARNADFGVPTYRDGEDRFYLLSEELAEVTPGVYRHLREERFFRAGQSASDCGSELRNAKLCLRRFWPYCCRKWRSIQRRVCL